MRGRKLKIGMVIICILTLFISGTKVRFLRVQAAAPPKTLSLAQAKSMALSNSASYRKVKSKLVLQGIKYQQALKSIALKKKNLATFSWSPLLSFKFPEKAYLDDEAQYLYKPLQIQSETSALKHSLTDIRFQTIEEISNLYVQLYTAQETIFFYENQKEKLELSWRRNKAGVLTGEAYQADVDSMEKKLKQLEVKLAAQMRTLEQQKEKGSKLLNLDITSGYRFSNPYVDAAIERSYLKQIIEYTLENDQQLYEVKLEAAANLATMNSNYGLMRNQYGSEMDRINRFLEQVKNGEKIDTDVFKMQYDLLLQAVDSPWNGQFRILFFRFPKEWLKGKISGVRYVEEDPYLLYINALDYQESLEEQKQTEKELRQTVRDRFENLVTTQNAYQAMKEHTVSAEEAVARGTNLNLLGEMTYEELAELQEELESARMDELEALDSYSQMLYSYDRLTCGAITMFLEGTGIEMGSVAGGNSYVIEETAEGAYYYINTKIEDNVFDLGIYVPDDYELDLTDYELWCNNMQVGSRTRIDKTIRHLMLDFNEVESVFIRFYDEDDFIDDCEINPQEYSGPLPVIKEYLVPREADLVWGEFSYKISQATQLITLKLAGRETREIAYYRIQDADGNNLSTDDVLDINQEFQYLSLVESDLENLIIKLYGKDSNLLTDAFFNLNTMEILADTG